METILNVMDTSPVPDLIRFQFLSFDKRDYSKVQTILTNRENAFITELENLLQTTKLLKSNHDFMEKKNGLAELAKIRCEDDLLKSRRDYNELIEKMKVLEKKTLTKHEHHDIMEESCKLDEIAKLREIKREHIVLNEKMNVLESKKLKKEEELEEYKRKFDKLNEWTLKLEEMINNVGFDILQECSAIEVSQKFNNEILEFPEDLTFNETRKRSRNKSEEAEGFSLSKRKTKNIRECENTWMCSGDMLSAFTKDPQLCMKAVCALYRQEIAAFKATYISLPFKRGLGLRYSGSELARYLINDDPEYQLSKSISEVQEKHPTNLKDCKMLAMYYYEQLFEIYQKKLDPFFCGKL